MRAPGADGPNRQVRRVDPVGNWTRMADRDETPDERFDRNWNELLQELRVAQTGVQFLFAFLLTLPFNDRFATVSQGQKATYVATLLCTALSALCLIAPVSHHRILFRRGRKKELVAISSNLAGIGLWFLWLSIVGAVFLIFQVVVGMSWGVAVGAAFAAAFIGIWYILPTAKR
jgi:O-antigen/teichoic acid export membrane protein